MGPTMSTRPVKRLYDLEIDEISLVDRPANQHGLVAIAKRDEGNDMPEIYDGEGYPVDEQELEHGDVVYDADGNEYQFIEDDVEDDTSAELQSGHDYELEDDRELVGVGKSFKAGWGLGSMQRAGLGTKGETLEDARRLGRSARVGRNVSANRGKYAAGSAVGGGGAYGMSKSLGDGVLEELSKALGQGERDEVIAKAMDFVQEANIRAARAESIAKALADQAAEAEFTDLAQGYGLPVHPAELGRIMKNAAATLPREDVETLDRLFSSVGEQLYGELGSNGSLPTSDVMEQVQALAYETVGKADVTQEQAVVALFEANPEAYDQYVSGL